MNDPDDSQAAAARRALANALQAWPDAEMVLACLNDEDVDDRSLLLQAIALCRFFLAKTTNPEAIYDVLLRDDPLHQALKETPVNVSHRARATDWLREQLAEGPQRLDDLKRANDNAQFPLPWKAISNAAEHIGVHRGGRGDTNSIWSLPPQEVLRMYLLDGPKSAAAVRATGLAHGVRQRDLLDAANAMGVVRTSGKWSLPTSKSASRARTR